MSAFNSLLACRPKRSNNNYIRRSEINPRLLTMNKSTSASPHIINNNNNRQILANQ